MQIANNTPVLPGVTLEEALTILRTAPRESRMYQRCREMLEQTLERGTTVPRATVSRQPKFLTIGMATYDDFDGCYFTVQSIRFHHPEILEDVEFLVLDNNPAGPCAKPLKELEHWAPNYRYFPHRSRQGTAVRDLIFREAAGEWVLCIDSHVLFEPGSLAKLIEYCRANPLSRDLLQGPLMGDDFKVHATCFEPKWSDGMFGVWGMQEQGRDPEGAPFAIEMQGLGVFGCRREAWPGFNPRLNGFGGEEGYIHEKIRRAGGRNLCLPFLRWLHRFQRPSGATYPNQNFDRIRNYAIIHEELGQDPGAMIAHFEQLQGEESVRPILKEVRAELRSPLHVFDAVYCVLEEGQSELWREMKGRLGGLGGARGVRRLAAAETPFDARIGRALSQRRVIEEAQRERLRSVLVLSGDVGFAENAREVLKAALRQLELESWDLLLLARSLPRECPASAEGCIRLPLPTPTPDLRAAAYRYTVFDAVLSGVPDNAVDVALWLDEHGGIEQFVAALPGVSMVRTSPVVAVTEVGGTPAEGMHGG